MFGFSFKKSAKKDKTASQPPSSPLTSTSSLNENEPSTSSSQSTSNFDFIVIKQVDSRPLYTSHSPSHLSPPQRPHSHSASHSPRTSIDWNDAVLRDSALAFGSQRRSTKSIKSTKSTTSHSSSNSRPSSPTPSSMSMSTRTSRASSRARYPSISTSTSSSAQSSAPGSNRSSFLESDDQAAWEAWEAFRAKYHRASFGEDEYEEKEDGWARATGGRYGPGRGYVEYVHRKSCGGDCEGRCFGK